MAGAGQLEALWQTVVEGDFFHSVSHERKHLGFQLFSILLPHLRSALASHTYDRRSPSAPLVYAVLLVPFFLKIGFQWVVLLGRRSEQVPAVLSRQFLRSLVNTTASPSAVLHGVARRCADRLAAHVAGSKDPHLAIAASVALQRHGGIGFDRLTKTKSTAKPLQVLCCSAQTCLIFGEHAHRVPCHGHQLLQFSVRRTRVTQVRMWGKGELEHSSAKHRCGRNV